MSHRNKASKLISLASTAVLGFSSSILPVINTVTTTNAASTLTTNQPQADPILELATAGTVNTKSYKNGAIVPFADLIAEVRNATTILASDSLNTPSTVAKLIDQTISTYYIAQVDQMPVETAVINPVDSTKIDPALLKTPGTINVPIHLSHTPEGSTVPITADILFPVTVVSDAQSMPKIQDISDEILSTSTTPFDLTTGIKVSENQINDTNLDASAMTMTNAAGSTVKEQDISVPGVFPIKYTFTNHLGKTAEATRNIIVVKDVNAPYFNYSPEYSSLVTVPQSSTPYALTTGITAQKSATDTTVIPTSEWLISATDAAHNAVKVNPDQTLNIMDTGTYTATYLVKNENLTSTITKTIEVVPDDTLPIITYSSGYQPIVNTPATNQKFDLTAGINAKQAGENGVPIPATAWKITILNSKNENVPVPTDNMLDISEPNNIYSITYSIADPIDPAKITTIQRTINVQAIELTPIITKNTDFVENPTILTSKTPYSLIEGFTVAESTENPLPLDKKFWTITVDGTAVTSDSLDVTQPGIHKVHYVFKHPTSGIEASMDRTITVTAALPQINKPADFVNDPTMETSATPYSLTSGFTVQESATDSTPIDSTQWDIKTNLGTITNGALDITKAGTYQITYTFTNSVGGIETLTRTITVTQNPMDLMPVVSYSPNFQLNVMTNTSTTPFNLYTGISVLESNLPAAASIAPDKWTITARSQSGQVTTITNGQLNISSAGTWAVTYTFTNTENKSIQIIRMITAHNLPDIKYPPTITVNDGTETNPTLSASLEPYNLVTGLTAMTSNQPGASYIDPIYWNITAATLDGTNIPINNGKLDISKAGKCVITYVVTNAAGLATTLTRTITVTGEAPTPAPDYDLIIMNSVVTINYVPGYGTLVYDAPNGKATYQYLPHSSSWKTWYKAVFPDGSAWYNVGRNQWIRAEYAVLATPGAPAIPVTGTARITYIPGYGINLWNGYGKNARFSGRRLSHNTNWQVFKLVRDDQGQIWYNLGGNQWIMGKYVILSITD